MSFIEDKEINCYYIEEYDTHTEIITGIDISPETSYLLSIATACVGKIVRWISTPCDINNFCFEDPFIQTLFYNDIEEDEPYVIELVWDFANKMVYCRGTSFAIKVEDEMILESMIQAHRNIIGLFDKPQP